MRLAVLVLIPILLVAPLSDALPPQDDAATGGDAPETQQDAARVEPARRLQGNLTGVQGDRVDWYFFDAQAGQLVTARLNAASACIYLHSPLTEVRSWSCSAAYGYEGGVVAEADVDGAWAIRIQSNVPQTYFFSVGVDEVAPGPIVEPFETPVVRGLPPVSRPTGASPRVVVAVVDTGINPYHDFFRDSGASHPAASIPGFPPEARTVNLSFDAQEQPAALDVDESVWRSLRRSAYDPAQDSFDTHLYWFQDTRVAGLSFGEYGGSGQGRALPVYDDHGHGTLSAGLAAGAGMPSSDADVLVVAVEVSDFATGIRWSARQPWVDVISVSAGTRANAPLPGVESAVEEAVRAGKAILMAAGNGATGTLLLPDRCSTHTSPYTGPLGVVRIGAASPKSGSSTWWHCAPVDATAATGVRSTATGTYDRAIAAVGTSASTPNAAGHLARLLLEARREGMQASPIDALQHLLNASSPSKGDPSFGYDPSSPASGPWTEGFGMIDAATWDRAWGGLLAGRGPHPRPEMDAWRAVDIEIRRHLWGDSDGAWR